MGRREITATRYGEIIDLISCRAIANGAKPKGEVKRYNRENFGEQEGAKWPQT